MIEIQTYDPKFQPQIPGMILDIQQGEFGVPVTLADQPDLLNIPNFYQSKKGNFWLAILDKKEVVGTIGLVDTDFGFGTIRKMFVKKNYRGSEYSIANNLYLNLEIWAIEHGLNSLLLGTRDQLKAALRFYEKHGFSEISKKDLPEGFPLMPVDNLFFEKKLTQKND